MQRSKYTAEFKAEAVKQVVDKGHTVVDVASRLRCGHQYFLASPLLRKFTRMDNYPVVKASNACEAWSSSN
jgi:hypothetical protein